MYKLFYIAGGEVEFTRPGSVKGLADYASKEYSHDEESAERIRQDLMREGAHYCDLTEGVALVIVHTTV